MKNDAPGLLPIGALILSTFLLAIAGKLFVNLNEDPDVFIVFTVLAGAPGVYLLIAAAVAKGIEMARPDRRDA